MPSSLYFWYAAALMIFPWVANADVCTEGFLLEANKSMNLTANCTLNSLGAEFAWKFDNSSRQLDIAFGARLETETAWLAWGLNPQGPHMVGTRALIGIRNQDGLTHHMYNITDATKRRCQLRPSDNDIGLNVTNFTFRYVHRVGYYVIQATIVDLPHEYNVSSTHVVWQVGEATRGGQPAMHPKSLDHLDCSQTINLISGKVLSYKPTERRQLRTAHGVLNIVGWGIFLPSGVIVARYFRSFPRPMAWWGAFHVGFQSSGFLLGSIGWGTGLWLGQASQHYTFTTHRILAIMIFTFTTIQMMALRLKPKRTDEYRTYWNMYHHFLGYSLLAVIVVNIFQGINIKEYGHHHSWRWSYIGVLALLGAVAIALEIYTWLKFWNYWGACAQSQKPTRSPSNAKAPATAPEILNPITIN